MEIFTIRNFGYSNCAELLAKHFGAIMFTIWQLLLNIRDYNYNLTSGDPGKYVYTIKWLLELAELNS